MVDLDVVAECLVAPDGDWEATWRTARQVHDELVAAFRRSDVDHVIAHGSFFYADEEGSPEGVRDERALPVLLSASYELALERVRGDSDRGISKDPTFLRWTHDRFAERATTLPPFALSFDTAVAPIEEIAETVVSRLLA